MKPNAHPLKIVDNLAVNKTAIELTHCLQTCPNNSRQFVLHRSKYPNNFSANSVLTRIGQIDQDDQLYDVIVHFEPSAIDSYGKRIREQRSTLYLGFWNDGVA